MSTWMYASCLRAERNRGRSRRLTAAAVPAGSIGRNWLYRADSLSETLTRGIDPSWSRSSRATSGQMLTSRARPSINFRYACLIRVGVALAGRGLAQKIEREGKPLLAEPGDGLQHLFDLGPRDEPLRHPHGVAAGVECQGLAEHGVRLRNLEAQPHGPRKMGADLVEILLQMAGDRLVIVQHGEHVDEAEHLHFDRFVGHGPGEDAVVPPAAVKNRGGRPRQLLPQLAAQLLGLRLDRGGDVGGRRSRRRRPFCRRFSAGSFPVLFSMSTSGQSLLVPGGIMTGSPIGGQASLGVRSERFTSGASPEGIRQSILHNTASVRPGWAARCSSSRGRTD